MADKLNALFPPDISRSHYSFCMREIVTFMRGLAFHISGDFKLQNVLDSWGYQAELIFMDQLSSQSDISKFNALIVEHMSEFYPEMPMNLFMNGVIFLPEIVKDDSFGFGFGLYNDDGLSNIVPATTKVDELLFSDLQLKLKTIFIDLPGEKLHKMTIFDAIKISSKLLYNNVNIILVGDILQNQNEIVSVASYLGNFKIHRFSHEKSSSKNDLKATWDMMLQGIYQEIVKSRRLQVLLFKYDDFKFSWQWDDIRRILNKCIPASCIDSIGSKVKICTRLLKVIITMEASNELRSSIVVHPFLKKVAAIHWIHPLDNFICSSITSEILNFSFVSQYPELLEGHAPFSDLAFLIYKNYVDSPSKTYNIVKQCLPAPYEQFCSMIKLFKRIYTVKRPILDGQIKKFQQALSKIEVIIQLLDEIELYFYKCRKVSFSNLIFRIPKPSMKASMNF